MHFLTANATQIKKQPATGGLSPVAGCFYKYMASFYSIRFKPLFAGYFTANFLPFTT